ncbi:metalloprotease TldD [Pseudoxanthomonas winnipegensis]|uniref:metalloprotease TldD n=1 Tax=Pseudoxanthomonas winnipegensis TaxID=2480810 RepID=UPI0030F3C850
MSSLIAQAERRLLTPACLSLDGLDRVFARLLAPSTDEADLYFQQTRSESWSLEDGIVKQARHSSAQGVGLRAVCGDRTGFAYTDAMELPALLEAAGSARAIAQAGGQGRAHALVRNAPAPLYEAIDPIDGLAAEEKVALLRTIDAAARALDPRIRQVSASLMASCETVLIVAADGTLVADMRPLVRLNVQVIAEHDGRRESGSAGGGGRYDLATLIEGGAALDHTREAVRRALVNLESVAAPAGEMTVVVGPGWPGVLLHEAVGHGLEGDFNRKQTSVFSERMGQRVAAKGVTIVDDGTLAGRRGSLSVDDEGTPTQRTTLIEDGVLKGYLHDRMSARLMGKARTGNGRRESYAHLPMPRMTNTYMLPGEHAPEEILRSVRRGLYAVNFAGGQVDITSGKFVFSANEAYLVEDGRIVAPVRGATLIGAGAEVLSRVSMIGNDLRLDAGIAICGKAGQSVPVGVGQPTLRIDAMTVGGTAA